VCTDDEAPQHLSLQLGGSLWTAVDFNGCRCLCIPHGAALLFAVKPAVIAGVAGSVLYFREPSSPLGRTSGCLVTQLALPT
jgi:hypothetical protein